MHDNSNIVQMICSTNDIHTLLSPKYICSMEKKLSIFCFACFPERDYRDTLRQLGHNYRLSYGAGIAVLVGPMRLEVNYCWPVKMAQGDRCGIVSEIVLLHV